MFLEFQCMNLCTYWKVFVQFYTTICILIKCNSKLHFYQTIFAVVLNISLFVFLHFWVFVIAFKFERIVSIHFDFFFLPDKRTWMALEHLTIWKIWWWRNRLWRDVRKAGDVKPVKWMASSAAVGQKNVMTWVEITFSLPIFITNLFNIKVSKSCLEFE